jgi:murein DD-endopeptidase MepM/ murein hydrolase activator NlpD
MTSIKKYNYLSGIFHKDFNGGFDRLSYVMDNMMSITLDSLIDDDFKETEAICVSGYKDRESNGQGLGIDSVKFVKTPGLGNANQFNIYVKVRRTGNGPVEDNFVPNPFNRPGEPSPEFTKLQTDIINDGFHEWAKSEITYQNQNEVPIFGQKLVVKEDMNGNLTWRLPLGATEALAYKSAGEGGLVNLGYAQGNLLGSFPQGQAAQGDQIVGCIPPIKLGNGIRVTSRRGLRTDPVTGEQEATHGGVDVGAPEGTPLVAVYDGFVVDSRGEGVGGKAVGGFGAWVVIGHKGFTADGKEKKFYTVYGHILNSYVKTGDIVKQGDHVADVGNRGKSTGPHLHFEVSYNKWRGPKQDPIYALGLDKLDGWAP